MHPNIIISQDLNNIASYRLDWSRFEGKTVLISGANGFLPAYMVETLLYLKHIGKIRDIQVIALVRNQEKAMLKFQHHANNESLKFIVQDVSLPITYDKKIDFIVHAASQASPKYYGTDPVGTLTANTMGTANMLDLAKNNKVESMLNFSSGEVYGIATSQGEIKETDYGYIDINNVRSCYAESKRMGETMCVSWAQQYGIPVKSVRPFHTYGPGMMLDDGRVFADFVRNIVHNQDIVINSDGSAERAFCYLADAAKAFFTVLLNGEQAHSYNVGNPTQAISIKELAQTLVGLFPEKKLSVKMQPPKDGYMQSQVAKNTPDISKIKYLGWEPEIDVRNGFLRTINSYR